jgi:hypothetical protein
MYNGKYIHFYFSWSRWFLFTLLGAIVGAAKKEECFVPGDMIFLLISIIAYYAVMFLGAKEGLFRYIQIFSIVPLLTTTYYFYKFCNGEFIKRFTLINIQDV